MKMSISHVTIVSILTICTETWFNALNAKLNPLCYLLALLAHHILHVSRIKVKVKLKWQMASLAIELLEYILLVPLPLEAVDGAYRGGFVTGE
jgi:hypothetical protein